MRTSILLALAALLPVACDSPPPAPVRPLLTSPDDDHGPRPTRHEAQIKEALERVVPGMSGYGICDPQPGEVTTADGEHILCWRVDVSVVRRAEDGRSRLQTHSFWFKDEQPVRAQVEGLDPISLVGAPPR